MIPLTEGSREGGGVHGNPWAHELPVRVCVIGGVAKTVRGVCGVRCYTR